MIMFNLNKKISRIVRNRIIFNIILFLAVFYTPWWFVVILALIGCFLYPLYFEIFIFGILLDILYGANAFTLGGVYGILGATVIFLFTSYARKAVR